MGKSKYTGEQLDFLREFIPGHSEREIISSYEDRFGVRLTINIVGNMKTKLGVKSGTIGGRFRKGMTPVNKGKKWSEFMSPEGMENSRKTQFKKGNVNHNNTPVGTERITKDGYIEIRMEKPRKTYENGFSQYYRLKHRVLWEQAHGPIPRSHAIVFLDQNPLNCVLENLRLVSRAELARLNQNHLFVRDAELNKAACLVAKVITAAGRAKKQKKENKK